MIIQSIDPSVTIDALLAKNMLWFFGHPVVYLLPFPAVAIFYLFIPRYAKKELVAGRVVAFAWFVAVIVNVIVWAHHVYLDYPAGSIQDSLNTAMQPLTYAIVRAAVGDQHPQPVDDGLAFRLRVDAGRQVPRRGDHQLARGRPSGDHQRDDRLRRRRTQHDVDRGPFPQHGPAEHRARDLRGGVRVPAAPGQPPVVLREPRQRPPLADRDRRLRHGAADARAGPRGRTAALRGAALRVRRVDPADDPVRGDDCPRPGRVRVQPHPDAARQGPPAPGDGAALARLHRVARRRRGGPRRHGARAQPRGRGREPGEAGARRRRRQVRHGRRGTLRIDLRELPQPQVGRHDRQRGAGPRQAQTRRRARAEGDRAGWRRQRHDAARAPARRGRKARIGLRRPGRGQVAIAADPASERLALAAAGLSLGAALIHASVTAAHFREYWLFGLLFAIVAPLQLAWAELVRRRPRHRRLLAVGALGNGAVAVVWIASRTTGLPIGPDAGEPEPLGVKDVLATADELVCAAIVAVLLDDR